MRTYIEMGVRRLGIACVAGVAVLALTPAAGLAGGSKINWTIGTTGSAGTTDAFSYRLALPHGDTATLDEEHAKRGTWKAVATLTPNPAGRGTGTTPTLKQGTYFFSIAINNRKGKAIASSSTIEVKIGPAPPKVSWTLQSTANENAAIPYSWTVTDLATGESIVIQQPEGTKKVWTTISTLPAASGTGSLPGLGIGANYSYRIAAVNRAGVVLAEQPASVSVYGQVSLATLVGGDDNSTYSSPSNTFPYVFAADVDDESAPNIELSVSAQSNDCTSIHLDFIPGDDDSDTWSEMSNNYSATVTVVQESANPVSVTAPFNSAATLDAPLVPGQSWSIEASGAARENEYDGQSVYIDGYAICDSTSPISSND